VPSVDIFLLTLLLVYIILELLCDGAVEVVVIVIIIIIIIMSSLCIACMANFKRLEGPGIESRWCEIFRTRLDRQWGPSSLLYNGYWVSFPGVKRPGRGVDHPSHRLKKE